MKKFLVILSGSYVGGFILISATFNSWDQGSGSPYTYGTALFISFFISLIFSLIGRYSLRTFSIKDESLLTLGVIFFVAQVIAYLIAFGLPDFGIFTLFFAILLCSMGAGLTLRLIKIKTP
jgi:hypothetical protein